MKEEAGALPREAPKSTTVSLVMLALGWVMIYADRLSISPLMDVIKSEFHLTYTSTSLVLDVYFAAYIGFTIPATMAASRWGYRRVMATFLLLAAVSLALAGVAGYVFSLLVFFIGIHGVGAGAFYPTAYKISTDTVPREKRGFTSAVINSGMGFGTMLGLIIAGPVLYFFSSWQIVFLILAVPTALVALLLFRIVPDANVSSYAQNSKFEASKYAEVLRNGNFLLISAMMFCSLYGYWVILSWGPTLIQKSLHLSVFWSGGATAVFAAVAIPCSIIISNHSDRAGRKKIALLILPLAGLTIFLVAYTSSLTEFLFAMIAYGVIGKLSLDPIAIAWVADVTPAEQIGPSLALLNVVAMSSSIFASIVTGAIGDYTGALSDGFYLGGFVVLLGAVFVALVKSRS